ncbi:alkanesulfonate monooxygenase SsuD/methylene tetrahydromethanopterin reductase-like flavin-dependent oxidoreductase (luciferase family) [Nonomuraea fuscirosea]|uniref:Alkanesulfonate monooxygenase SsuD/methylene tetrahydromethanopterin reductase-like flavin-dependent oxidoreductase (Luciferase family) n=1 Tax=Nonomuraea fuscirosea TaxID=1291556 RepID=A0A2T0MRF1_9ACTN|nr:LLM class flavin-dependent oxidoreductase [Nonomuraea fuscirosea]PRX60813.1 alkanesulfonate monooxygenase SsuD/methylene tetrahydromethanopterin reductase-like flavin-dependent oxidoreductase (luciferase family) [Nonomuraea fuscirosea]
MPDYGHDLLFSVSVVPSAQEADGVVALARLAERAGLDLVSFQDHPYQPALLDTWTLLGYVAAATETIRLAGNVHPLPLRPPAMLAQAAASLDLLSHGRFELALGTGGYWDAIASMGAPRLTPGQAVDALEEGIAIIRAAWDTDAPGGIRHLGEHYRVEDAPRGPRPAHDIGVWLGAYKPRMLRLTGRLADGWLPSLPRYRSFAELGAGNAVIDEAAAEAGRSPAAIRRLLNLDRERAPEELAELALDHGVSVFILTARDARTVERFAAETAPAVRALVAAGRSPAVPEPPATLERHPATSERAPTTPERHSAASERAPASAGRSPMPAEPGKPPPSARTGGAPLAAVPTPDDGVRLSSVRVWDESTRPAGPAPDPHRRYSPREQAAGRHLIDVHDHLRAELAQLRDLADQVAAGTLDAGAARDHISTMTMRQNNWTLGAYCESYCRLVTMHHSAEDAMLFPHLRRVEPGLAPVLDRLREEHQAIHKVLERVDRALVAFVTDPAGLADLRGAVDLLTDTLLSHLSYEEHELVEPLARHGL